MIQLKSKSQAVVIFSVVGLLVAILLTVLVLVPQFSSLKDLSDTAEAKQEQLRLGKEKVKSIKDGVNLIANSKKDIDALGVAIPKTPEAESALLQISSAASAAGVSISSIAVSDTGKTDLRISLSITGPYDKTTDFVSKMESNLRPTQFADFTINASEQADLTTTFNLVFPYLEAQAVATKATGTNSNVSDSETSNREGEL